MTRHYDTAAFVRSPRRIRAAANFSFVAFPSAKLRDTSISDHLRPRAGTGSLVRGAAAGARRMTDLPLPARAAVRSAVTRAPV